MFDILELFKEFEAINVLVSKYKPIIIDHCEDGNIKAIKDILEKNPLLKKSNGESYIMIACKYNHFNILEYLMNYFDDDYFNTNEDNIFNGFCRKNNINAIKNIIKITAKNRQVINFNINEYREYGTWGEYIGPIITHVKNPVVFSYLTCCGAGMEKLI